jgi:outer membrane lipoprotein carrier protein
MKQIIITAIYILIFTAATAMAKDATLEEVVATVEAGYAGLKDLQASFSQSTTVVGLPKAQKGQGELLLRRPPGAAAQFRFDYTLPKQNIVSNGKTVWFYIPDNKQVMVSSTEAMFKGGNSIALSYLTGLGNVSKDFSPAFARETRDKKGNYLLELTPRKPTPSLAKLRLTIDQSAVERFLKDEKLVDTFPVLASLLIDASGNETRISYSKARVNSGLGAGRFSFKIPEGTELIKP